MSGNVNMWLKDHQGQAINGDSKIQGREKSCNIFSIEHSVRIPFDHDTGKVTATRKHKALIVVKPIDPATPILNKACCNGELLQDVKILLYKINDNGEEKGFFQYSLNDARVVDISPIIDAGSGSDYMEAVSFSYDKITWNYLDGNILASDTWLERV
jgi:type VI secretion system secreted protein Hcp